MEVTCIPIALVFDYIVGTTYQALTGQLS